MDPVVIGIDLGGTKINTALVQGDGVILAQDYRPTLASEGLQPVVERVLDSARQVLAQAGMTGAQVSGVGIGAPGPIDLDTGVLMSPPNLPGWERVPLGQLLEDDLGITTFLENDANAAAWGEHYFGAGRGVEHMIYVTVSTGVGGGLILDGNLYHGANGMAGEIGHIILEPDGPLCGCGSRGCLETLASGTAIARVARERVAQGVPTLMDDLAEGVPERITAQLVVEAARQGDKEADGILAEAMEYLGIGMANLVNLFNPQLIVIGGGVANIGERLFHPVRRAIERNAFRMAAQVVRVAPAELGGDVGVLGAAAVALSRLA